MRKLFGFGLLALALAPITANADPWKDESGKGREREKEFRKHQEKLRERQEEFFEERRERTEEQREKERERQEEARERYREAIERRREKAEERREAWERFGERHDEGRWTGPPYVLAPSYRHGHGHGPGYGDDRGRYGDSVYGGYADHGYDRYRHRYGSAYGPSYVVPPYALPPEEDDLDAVYTPFGFYEEVPDVGYGGYGPRPKGYGRIGPYRFEVWEND